MGKQLQSFISPDLVQVTIYFIQMGLLPKHAEAFFLYYSKLQWKTEKGPVKNWKVLAYNYVASFAKAKPITKRPLHC